MSYPVGRATNVWRDGDRLKASVQFANSRVQGLVEVGVLRATSVGFAPLKWNFNRQRDGIDFHEQELLEFSVVNIPANAEALLETSAGKSMTESERARARRQREVDVMRLRYGP